MTMGLQWTHAEFVGEGEGLLVVGLGLITVVGGALYDNGTQKLQSPGLSAALAM